MGDRRKVALVGTGGRAAFYLDALTGQWAETWELVALCDRNAGRLELAAAGCRARGASPRRYAETEFARLLAESGAEVLVIATPCGTHAQYAVQALRAGLDVICEKAMAVNAQQVQEILAAQAASGRRFQVTFNLRYTPPAMQLKQLLMDGVIGEVLSLDFHWLLNTTHGADYFRRWHRHKALSGGLQIHKAVHHFDLIQWLLSDVPRELAAQGGLRWYTPATAERMGLSRRGVRCHGCAEAARCPFFFDLAADAELKRLYLDQEGGDGYWRDQCVFSPDTDIEDTLHVLMRTRGGVQLNYSLHAWMPWEGFTLAINGSRGRLEHLHRETVYQADGVGGQVEPEIRTRIIPHFANGHEETIWQGSGMHGGGDERMLAELFAAAPPPDPLRRAADQRSGAWTTLTGVAINQALRSGDWVRLEDLAGEVELPDFTPMPEGNGPLALQRAPGVRPRSLP